jgi:hypothetical protein
MHPARSMPFDQLYAAVQAEVTAGTAHCTTDTQSGLQVFCYDLSSGPPTSSTAAMCRGLVLHPASSSIVATPFARFGGPKSVPVMRRALAGAATGGGSSSSGNRGECSSRGGRASSKGRGGRGGRGQGRGRSGSAGTATGQPAEAAASTPSSGSLQLYQHWEKTSSASASVKIDGSFVLAFLWQSQLYTATRWRMDSEQVGACRSLQMYALQAAMRTGCAAACVQTLGLPSTVECISCL